ncbi:DHA2 family efflux MFS transporter permease subunit [Actinokineospora sp. G85]|uniref:DHA2 family efflux MFS transporter permease subunit n=1 Tax=Actinokineospora sp. G85 TaxID=3406626 RepID=UPI003C77CAC5
MATPAAAPPAGGDKLDPAVLKVAGVVVLGVIMSILDVTVVSVALPTFAEEFQSSYATVAWTMTGYTLALAAVIPLTGWAADRFGTKRLYITALVLFVLGSVLCSMAWDVTTLITFRVLQGLGGGMLLPLGMTIMTKAAGPDRIGRVMAVLGVPMLLGPIGGPILGGWMIDALSWHWIFLINLPIGIIALVAAIVALPKDNPSPSETFDYVGMLLLSPGLALLLFGVSSIPETGTLSSTRVLVPALVGLALVVGFVFHALRQRHPLIDLRLFQNRQLTTATITLFLFAVAFFGAMLLVPSYFLQVRGETTLAAGLLLAPQGLGAMISMPIAGRLADKTGAGRIVLTGMVPIAIGMGVLTQLSADTSYVVILGVLFLMGLGMGASMMPLMSAALQTLTDHTVARGSTLMNIVQQVAASIGTAVMSVVLTSQIKASDAAARLASGQVPPQELPGVLQQAQQDSASGFATAFTVAFVLLVLTLAPALLLPRHKAQSASAQPAPVVMH